MYLDVIVGVTANSVTVEVEYEVVESEVTGQITTVAVVVSQGSTTVTVTVPETIE